MYNGILHAHSGLRWIALLLLVATVFVSFSKWKSKESAVSAGVSKLYLFNMIMFHIQLLLGIALLFLSPKVTMAEGWMKDSVARFFTMEHTLMMIIAVALVTIGRAKMKRGTGENKHKPMFIFSLIALIIVLAMIPWPFRNLGAGWF